MGRLARHHEQVIGFRMRHEREREQIRKIAESFRGSEVDLSTLYQEVLLRKPQPAALTAS